MTGERPSPERTAAIRELAENVLAQTWGGGELPIGPGISGSFTNNVRRAKDLARGTLDLLAALAAETARREEAEKWANTMEHERDWETQVVHSELLSRATDAEAERDALVTQLEQAREALQGLLDYAQPEGYFALIPSKSDALAVARAALAALQEAPSNGEET